MTQPPYGAPNAGAPGQNPYDPGPQRTTPSPSAPTKKVSAVRIAVIAGVTVVALVGSPLAFMAGRSSAAGATTPAATTAAAPATQATTAAKATKAAASPTTETACDGASLTGAVWWAKVPVGWQCSGKQALGLSLATPAKDTITLLVSPATDDSACAAALSLYPTLTKLPDADWGGQPAVAAERDLSGKAVSYRCTIRNGRYYLLTGTPLTGTSDAVRAGVDALVASWAWA